MKQAIFELICTGNELIMGKVLNTNSNWLAKRITKLGGKITRMIVVPDNLELISKSIKESLNRKPDFIITSGGLGSTFDDMTLKALSNALNIPLKLNSEVLRYIEEKYNFAQKAGLIKDGGLNKYRKKMALVPEDSKILYNSIGAAPGVVIENQNTQLICLPGVPSELKSIFRKGVVPLIRKRIGDASFIEKSLFITGFIESEITHIVDKVMDEINKDIEDRDKSSITTKSTQVWIKTLTKAPYKKIIIEFHISCFGLKKFSIRKVEHAVKRLKELIVAEGGNIYDKEESI